MDFCIGDYVVDRNCIASVTTRIIDDKLVIDNNIKQGIVESYSDKILGVRDVYVRYGDKIVKHFSGDLIKVNAE